MIEAISAIARVAATENKKRANTMDKAVTPRVRTLSLIWDRILLALSVNLKGHQSFR